MQGSKLFCDCEFAKCRRSEVVSSLRRSSRRKLQDKYDSEVTYSLPVRDDNKNKEEGIWKGLNLSNMSVSKEDATRMLRSGADKLSRTLSSVQTTFGELSQKFRRSTRRRHRLNSASPNSSLSPQTRSRRILGRTPTKLYSPFGIETPCRNCCVAKEKENCVNSTTQRCSDQKGTAAVFVSSCRKQRTSLQQPSKVCSSTQSYEFCESQCSVIHHNTHC